MHNERLVGLGAGMLRQEALLNTEDGKVRVKKEEKEGSKKDGN